MHNSVDPDRIISVAIQELQRVTRIPLFPNFQFGDNMCHRKCICQHIMYECIPQLIDN